MAIQVFKPYFFTKENHIKIVPLDMLGLRGTAAIATPLTSDINYTLQNYSYSDLTKNGEALRTIIDRLEAFTSGQTVEELKAIEDEIQTVLFAHWKEELLHYVKIIQEALSVPSRIEQLNKSAVDDSPQNQANLKSQFLSLEKSLLTYPFDNKKEITEELVQLKEQCICEKEVQLLEEAMIQLEEKITEEDFSVAAYRQMKSEQSKLEDSFEKMLQTEQVIVLQKRFNQIKQSISKCKTTLYSYLSKTVDEVEIMEILELLAVQPSNLITNRKRFVESVMEIPKDKFETTSGIEEILQKTAALCLVQEAESPHDFTLGLDYLEWEAYIDIGREGRSRVISYFWKDRSNSLSSLQTEEELRNSIYPYIKCLHEEVYAVNEATTFESMLTALRTLNIYDAAQYSEKELKNGANYLLLLKETEALYSINRIKQAFNKGMQNDKQVTTSNGLSVYISEDSIASNLQLQTSSTDSNEIKIPIAINKINSGSTETITLYK